MVGARIRRVGSVRNTVGVTIGREAGLAETTMHVPEIMCEGCATTILNALDGVPGVGAVRVDVPARQVTVEYVEDRVALPAIRERIERAGFDVEQ